MNACRDIGDRRKASILNQNIDEEDNGTIEQDVKGHLQPVHVT